MNIVHRVEVRDFKIDGISVRLHYNPTSGDVEIKATANVTDVVTGEPTTVNQYASVFADILSNHPDVLADFIERAVVDLVTHEVHEKLFINGKRWREPHPERLAFKPLKQKEVERVADALKEFL